MTRKRPRQADVAKLAGVSPATVSVILNNRLNSNVRVSEETRARVLEAVEQLGYVSDPVARSLAGGQNSLLGIFAFDTIFSHQYHFPPPFWAGLEQEAEQLGYDLVLFTNTTRVGAQRQIYQGQINRLRMADGAILLNADAKSEDLQRLLADRYPYVCVGACEFGDDAISYVVADYATAAARIVNEMLVQGHHRISYWITDHNHLERDSCYAGYLRAYHQFGLTQELMPMQQITTAQPIPTLIARALAAGSTAFVLECDTKLIVSFFAALAQLGKATPSDVSVGILGEPDAGLLESLSITHFRVPWEEMGRRAIHLLIPQLQDSLTPRDASQQTHQSLLTCIHVSSDTIGPPPVF